MKRERACILTVFLLMMGLTAFAETFELTGGPLKLVLYPEIGSFTLYRLSDVGKNRYEALIEDRNFGTTNWFSVLSDGRVFKLGKRTGKPVVLEPTEHGARFIFTLTDDFQVEQEFSLIPNRATGTPSALLIETRIENTSGREMPFALKALLDTMLGETEGIHYFTDVRNRISSETRIQPGIDPDSVIVSRKGDMSFALILDSDIATRPESVFASNWERLNTLTWKPDFLEGRSFNTLYSVQDSALLAMWPEKTIAPNAKYVVRAVIGPYVEGAEYGSSTLAVSAVDREAVFADAAQSVSVSLTEHERQVRIRDLLDRIALVEKNPDKATDEQLAQMNRELDALLESGAE